MYRSLFILIASFVLLNSCDKSANKENSLPASDEDKIIGTWKREGTNGIGSGNTLEFSKTNGAYTLSFDCSGSPGPNWPSNASTAYKFENGKLVYMNYYDNSLGFFTVSSFSWITPGTEFEVKFHHLLLFMSADYTVKYKKT